MNNIIFGKTVFIPAKSHSFFNGNVSTGDIYYKPNINNYKTINPKETIESKLSRMSVLITDNYAYAVGLEYIENVSYAPLILLQTRGVNWIKSLCYENNIPIIYKEFLAPILFYNVNEYSYAPEDTWQEIAEIFSKLI